MDAKQLAEYYKDITETAHMKRIKFEREYSIIEPSNFKSNGNLSGLLSGKLTESALLQIKRDLHINKTSKPVDILIIPKVLQTAGDNSNKVLEAALVIPARLKGSTLYPNTESEKSYIPRDYLKERGAEFTDLGQNILSQTRELSDEELFYFGTFDKYKSFNELHKSKKLWNDLIDNRVPEDEQWCRYVQYSFEMFDKVVNRQVFNQDDSPFELFENNCYIVKDKLINPAAAITPLYEAIKRNANKPELALFCSLPHALRNNQSSSDNNQLESKFIINHAGTMDNQFPLAKSQRRAMHFRTLQQDGQILAVSGPPGTGKTTLLKGIIADLMVKHAIEGKSAPLIVGTSTNNQAVTNIIESFAGIGGFDDTDPLYCRWLPDIQIDVETSDKKIDVQINKPLHSLGTYMPAFNKRKNAATSNYLIDDFPAMPNGLYDQCSKPEYINSATKRILKLAKLCNINCTSIETISDELLKTLRDIDSIRQDLIKNAYNIDKNGLLSKYYKHKFEVCIDKLNKYGIHDSIGNKITYEDIKNNLTKSIVEKIDEILDVTVRPFEFWLSLHYFECQWIIKRNKHLTSDEKSNRYQDCFERYWEQLSTITPLIVMTMYRLPSKFSYTSKYSKSSNKTYAFAKIDLLIVDEAGQVDTAIGAAALSLAKQAIIVGDVKQLPPVWNVSEMADTYIASKPLQLETFKEWEKIRNSGLTASQSSSLMKAAQAACPWYYTFKRDGKEDFSGGLFLSEHRRCLDSIIGYCNDLLYNGLLEPKRGDDATLECEGDALINLPPMGFVSTLGNSQRQGTSRINIQEADAIANWLYKNYPTIRAQYIKTVMKAGNNPNKEVVGIVTPFKAQADLILKKLKNFDKTSALRCDTSTTETISFAREITVGTAHALQGAERPVVIFSLVYAGNDNPIFVESNKELMNVAVSRAKDSFIVFGDKTLLSNATGEVLSLLWSYCKDNDCSAQHTQETPPPLEFKMDEDLSLTDVIKLMRQHYPEINKWFEDDRAKKMDWANVHRPYDVQLLNVVFECNGLIEQSAEGKIPTQKGGSIGISLKHVVEKNKEFDKVVYSESAVAWIVNHFQELVSIINLD